MIGFMRRLWRWHRGRRPYLTYKDDPVLAELWDNEEDAVFDDL